jgi:hypothetical protein
MWSLMIVMGNLSSIDVARIVVPLAHLDAARVARLANRFSRKRVAATARRMLFRVPVRAIRATLERLDRTRRWHWPRGAPDRFHFCTSGFRHFEIL